LKSLNDSPATMELPPVAEVQDAQPGDGGAAGVVADHGAISGKLGTPRLVKTGEEEQEDEDGGGDGAGEGQQGGRGDGAGGETSDNSDTDSEYDKEAASKPITAGKQNERETAEKLVHRCKMQLKKPEGPNANKIGEWEATMHMWDVWLDKCGCPCSPLSPLSLSLHMSLGSILVCRHLILLIWSWFENAFALSAHARTHAQRCPQLFSCNITHETKDARSRADSTPTVHNGGMKMKPRVSS